MRNTIEPTTGAREARLLDRFGQECYQATSGNFGAVGREHSLYRPWADEEHLRAGGPRPCWPGGARFAVCLTHDVDNVASLNPRMHWRKAVNCGRHLRYEWDGRAARALESSVVGLCRSLNPLRGSDPVCAFERWLAMEAEVGAKSTFLFLPERSNRPHYSDGAYRYSDTVRFDGQTCSVAQMMREIHGRGWEVGLHAAWGAFDCGDELKCQKEQVETVIDAAVTSVRHPHLHFDIRRTPRVHHEAGLLVDSSLGLNDNIGFRHGTCYPWLLHDFNSEPKKGPGLICPNGPEGASHKLNLVPFSASNSETELDVLELPLAVQDKCLVDILGCGSEDLVMDCAERIIERVEAVGGVLTILWHPGTLGRPLYENTYRRILKMLREKKAHFGTMREIGEKWLARGKLIRNHNR